VLTSAFAQFDAVASKAWSLQAFPEITFRKMEVFERIREIARRGFDYESSMPQLTSHCDHWRGWRAGECFIGVAKQVRGEINGGDHEHNKRQRFEASIIAWGRQSRALGSGWRSDPFVHTVHIKRYN